MMPVLAIRGELVHRGPVEGTDLLAMMIHTVIAMTMTEGTTQAVAVGLRRPSMTTKTVQSRHVILTERTSRAKKQTHSISSNLTMQETS